MTTTSTAPSDDPWYVLPVQDLVRGEVKVELCCPPMPAPGPSLTMAWVSTSGLTNGLLTLTEVRDVPGTTPSTTEAPVSRRVAGATLRFHSYGLSATEEAALMNQIMPGSGLPYVLPDSQWRVTAQGLAEVGARRSQVYSSSAGSVTLTVGDYRHELDELITGSTITQVTVAGNTGWKASTADGVLVVWPAGGTAKWATLRISAQFADRADALIAGVAAVPPPAATTPSTAVGATTTSVQPVNPSDDGGLAGLPVTTLEGLSKALMVTPTPTADQMQAAWITDPATVPASLGATLPSAPFALAWAIGDFTCEWCSRPPGAAAPAGNVVWAIATPDGVRTDGIGRFAKGTLDALAALGRPFPTVTPAIPPGTVYSGGVTAIIETPGKGPMLAFSLLDSLPPQGGDIALAGFDWNMVSDEQTAGGTTWTGPYTVYGTFDGTTFTLTAPPVPGGGPAGPTHQVITAGCTLAQMAPGLDGLGTLDHRALHIVSTSSDNYDGRCGVAVTAVFDTAELRHALAALPGQVTLTTAFHRVLPG